MTQMRKHPTILIYTWEENELFFNLKFRWQLLYRPAQLLEQPNCWPLGKGSWSWQL